jgi:hypothetical protein
MNEKRHTIYTLYVYLFALFWFFSGYSVVSAFADEGSSALSGLIQLRYDGRYLSHGEDDDHKLHQIADLTVQEKGWEHFQGPLRLRHIGMATPGAPLLAFTRYHAQSMFSRDSIRS